MIPDFCFSANDQAFSILQMYNPYYTVLLIILRLLPTFACMIICVYKGMQYRDTPVQTKAILTAT